KRTATSGPDGDVAYGYDGNGRLSTVTDPAGGVFRFGYDAGGRLASPQRPHGGAATLRHHPRRGPGAPHTAAARPPPGVAAGDALDGSGRGPSATDLAGTSTYGYDTLGQLLTGTHPAGAGPPESYGYDLAGNRTASATSPAGSWQYDAGQQLLHDADHSFGYGT